MKMTEILLKIVKCLKMIKDLILLFLEMVTIHFKYLILLMLINWRPWNKCLSLKIKQLWRTTPKHLNLLQLVISLYNNRITAFKMIGTIFWMHVKLVIHKIVMLSIVIFLKSMVKILDNLHSKYLMFLWTMLFQKTFQTSKKNLQEALWKRVKIKHLPLLKLV